MSDEVFRLIVAVGVGVIALSFVILAIAALGVLGNVKKLRQKLEPLADTAKPVIAELQTTAAKIGPVMETLSPMLTRAEAVMAKAIPVVDQAGKILANADSVLTETKPRITEVSKNVVEITKSGRQQVEKVGELVQDATVRARNRLEQIEHSVENTVEQVEHAGETMKRTVMRPVLEVNGIAAGISAAMAALVKKPRKSSVDSATADEEMFI